MHFFLSNFFPCPVRMWAWYDATMVVTFPSAEHAFQAAKATTAEWHERIREARSAGEAKRLGRQVPRRADWDARRLAVMHQVLEIKFGSDPLKGQLLATGDACLIEGNDWNDQFWGVADGKGLNWLGRLLMLMRSELHADA